MNIFFSLARSSLLAVIKPFLHEGQARLHVLSSASFNTRGVVTPLSIISWQLSSFGRSISFPLMRGQLNLLQYLNDPSRIEFLRVFA